MTAHCSADKLVQPVPLVDGSKAKNTVILAEPTSASKSMKNFFNNQVVGLNTIVVSNEVRDKKAKLVSFASSSSSTSLHPLTIIIFSRRLSRSASCPQAPGNLATPYAA